MGCRQDLTACSLLRQHPKTIRTARNQVRGFTSCYWCRMRTGWETACSRSARRDQNPGRDPVAASWTDSFLAVASCHAAAVAAVAVSVVAAAADAEHHPSSASGRGRGLRVHGRDRSVVSSLPARAASWAANRRHRVHRDRDRVRLAYRVARRSRPSCRLRRRIPVLK